jgi:hypothetical protein
LLSFERLKLLIVETAVPGYFGFDLLRRNAGKFTDRRRQHGSSGNVFVNGHEIVVGRHAAVSGG